MKLIRIITILAVLVTGNLFCSHTASADYPCTLTGYAYMGGTGFNISEQSYFIAGPMTYMFNGTDMWGFAFIKFDTIGTEEVQSAYLVVDLLKVGSMYLEDASETYPGKLDIYSPGDTDVASLATVSDAATLHTTLKASSSPIVSDFTMTANGTYAIDITDIYNAWVRGDQANNGLVLMSDSENSGASNASNLGPVGTKYAGLNGTLGTMPYITFSAPESAPTVDTTTPEASATGIDVGTSVTIGFDKPMATESVEQAFSMVLSSSTETAVTGTFSWNDLETAVTFTPTDLLTHETAYTVTMGTGAQSAAEKSLENEYTFSFTTGAYVAPDPEVEGTPDTAIVKDTISLTISGTGVYAYRYCLDDGDWSDACDPSDTLELSSLTDGDHTLKIQVQDSLGVWSDLENITWNIQCPPTVLSVSPEDGAEAAVTDTITVTFSEDMDKETVENGFTLSPAVDGSLSWEGKSVLVFIPDMVFEEQTSYTVTIAATAADLAGNTLGSAVTWSFTTLVASTVRCEVSEDTYVLYGGMGNGKGYPQGTSMGEYKLKAGAVYIVDARILMRFDLSPITDLGLTTEDIEAAYLVYTMDDYSAGEMDVGPPAPDGTAMYGTIYALSTDTQEKTGDTVDDFYWTEAVTGDGYVDMTNKPWYVPEAPSVLVTHTTGSYSTGKVDVAPIVKGWLNGQWENNGLELKDHDDQSWTGSTDIYGADYGDGYSWHLVAREDADDPPYLLVTYDTDKLRITDQVNATAAMLPGETRSLTASGGSGTYQWTVEGPDGTDVSASALSATTGSTVTFTAPDDYGLCSITVTCGSEDDRIYIGIGEESGTSQAPLYLPAGTTDEEKERLTGICTDALEQLGGFGSFVCIEMAQGDDSTQIGGTAGEDGAKMLITAIDDPAGLTGSKEIYFDTISGDPVTITITANSVSTTVGKIYVMVVDTGSTSPGGATGLFLFELYDENGEPLDDADILEIEITISYDASAAGSDDPFTLGSWRIVHAPDLETFFSGDEDADIEEIYLDNIVSVDEANQTVTFTTDHCSVYGTVSGTAVEATASTPDESVGGGCFINSLFR